MHTEPFTAEATTGPGPESGLPAGPASPARPNPWWTVATPWFMGCGIALALYLAYFTNDLLQNRLQRSSVQFEANTRRFERYWSLHDAAVEAALELRRDLSSPAALDGASDPASAPRAGLVAAEDFDADLRHFQARIDTLRREIGQTGVVPPRQAAAVDDAVARLDATLAGALSDAKLGPEHGSKRGATGSSGAAHIAALARGQTQQVIDVLTQQGRAARQQQAMSAEFLDEVEAVRRQVLVAIAIIVALLVLAVALAVQWIAVARRERAIRGRAEHLADVAEAERARAEHVARDKTRFLGMLSHELLTPLQSIWSTMDVIESRGRVDARDPAFTRLRESTRSLRGRISDLVDFAKMSSGRLEARIRGFQLDKLVESALREVEEALASKNLDVHWDPSPALSRRIYSDPARLRQIVDNLLTNAVKYTERGGVTIRAELLHDTSLLRFEIADTGVGIQPAALARLFEPFYRSPATAGMAEGSGLGLAVVRSLVDLMGGEIRVDSQVGQGTSIVVDVPVAECGDGLVEPPRRIDARLPVLVVDDSRDARRAIADVIRALGVDVHEADSGITGLAAAQAHDYHAILLDMQMPGLSGYEVAQRLREPGGRHEKTFLILVSAFSDLDEATAAGTFDLRIDKPAGRRDLMAALARVPPPAPADLPGTVSAAVHADSFAHVAPDGAASRVVGGGASLAAELCADGAAHLADDVAIGFAIGVAGRDAAGVGPGGSANIVSPMSSSDTTV